MNLFPSPMSLPRAALVVLALGAAGTLSTGCASSALSRARVADDLRQYDVAVANYMQAVRERPHDRDAQLALDRAKLRAADAHLLRGRRLFHQGRPEDALIELQLAFELNPTSAEAERDLRAVRSAMRAQLISDGAARTPLQRLLAETRDLGPVGHELPDAKLPGTITVGRDVTAREAYMLVASLAKISVNFDASFRDGPAQLGILENPTVKQALDAVAASTATFYQVTAPGGITVINDTPAKRREYTEEVARTFVLQNADLKETMDILRVAADLRRIAPMTATNSIVVTDTPERVRSAGRLISAFDKAPAEVVVTVEVLEVNRTRMQDYGLQLASGDAPGIAGAVDLDTNSEALTLQSLRGLSSANVFLTNVPALYYRLLKTDSNTRTLANPHLRMLDGTPASANFGDDVPIAKTIIVPVTQGGVQIQPQTTFEYRKVGVNIGITPRTHPNDEITLLLNIELSNISGVSTEGLPTIGSRTVQTRIRLKDGETNILAGLIREDERVERQTIPGLGRVPVLGSIFFARTQKEARQTDVVIMLTPHIVRPLDISAEDLRPLRMPREGAGSPLLDSAPLAPPPPIIRDGGGPVIRGGGGGSPDGPVLPPSLPVTAGMPPGQPMPPPRVVR